VLKETKKSIKDLIEVYSNHGRKLFALITKTYELLDKSRIDRDRIRDNLRQRLSKEASLRVADFDRMINEIISQQILLENRIKENINQFWITQENYTEKLKQAWQQDENLQIFNDLKGQIEQEIMIIIQLIIVFHEKHILQMRQMGNLMNGKLPLTVARFKEVIKTI